MTTPTPTRTELGALDERIVRALVALRVARAASARLTSPGNLQVEERAEGNLNALLEYRHSAQQRRAS
jgi:hypothetical protein